MREHTNNHGLRHPVMKRVNPTAAWDLVHNVMNALVGLLRLRVKKLGQDKTGKKKEDQTYEGNSAECIEKCFGMGWNTEIKTTDAKPSFEELSYFSHPP